MPRREYKVVVLGSGGVGKSALTVQYCCGTFVEKYDPTIEDFYRKDTEIDTVPITLEILDTAGTEQFVSMRDLYIQNGQGFLIVYSIANYHSLRDASGLKDTILNIKHLDEVPIVLAGNKKDLEDQREASPQDGKDLAKTWGCPFFETSAKQEVGIQEIFTALVREMDRIPCQSHGRHRRRGKRSKCTVLWERSVRVFLESFCTDTNHDTRAWKTFCARVF